MEEQFDDLCAEPEFLAERRQGLAFENIGWTVGNHCNARCGHCYSWKVRRDSREFLTHDDIDRVIWQLKRLGIGTVNLGGNEPIYTHGPDISKTLLPYIVRRLTEEQIPVGLTTNGVSFTWLDEHYPEELRMINDIDFSLDSPFEAEHDLNRASKLYKLILKCIERSLAIGIDCSVIACGMKKNFNEDYLAAYLSLTRMMGSEFRINTLKPVEPALVGEMPTAVQFYKGFEFLMNNTSCITLGESCLTSFTQAGGDGCPCGTTSFRINAKTKDGTIPINPCVYMHDYKSGDLLTQDIFDILRSPQFLAYSNRRKALPKQCTERGCEFLETCRGGCTARSYFIYGDLESKDPYCPQDYLETHGRPDLPHKPEIGCHEGIRVHDNYLCTWIGEADESFSDPRFDSVDAFLGNAGFVGDTDHMSGCRQLGPNESTASLVHDKES